MVRYTKKQKRISYLLKAIVFFMAIIGTYLSANAGRGTFMGTMWWIFALLIFLLLVGFLYLGIIKLLKKRK